MAMTRKAAFDDGFIMCTINDLVPQDHLVRKLEDAIDWNFIYPLVEDLYSPVGRGSVDPVVLFKLIAINKIFGIHSMRRTCKEAEVNLAYRWFLGLSFEDRIPNYSTWSQNYIRRYNNSGIFRKIFLHVIRELHMNGFLDLDVVYGDSTHRKACANKRKSYDMEVEIEAKAYDKELLDEINEQRRKDDKKEFDSIVKKEIEFDEATGEEREVAKTKHIKVSLTDPESGAYHKGEHERCFAYNVQTICEGNGFVIAVDTVPGNVHDSASFTDAYRGIPEELLGKIHGVCLDAGYKVPHICREIIEGGRIPYLPYKRPMTGKDLFRKREYHYDDGKDLYICPNGKELKYRNTTRDGYKQYRTNPNECEKCPFLKQCTKSKNHVKLIQRHIWEGYVEAAEIIRHTNSWKEIYPNRKETIERVFAENKENGTLRYTRLKGLKKNQCDALMIFACHNLKKMANWMWR